MASFQPVSWTFPISGDWNAASDWSTNTVVPGALYDVLINAAGVPSYTVSVSAAAQSAHSVTLTGSGATLSITNGFTLGSTLAVDSGTTLSLGSGGVINGGTVIANGGSEVFAGGTLNGVTWQGTLDLSGASDEQLYIANGITLTGTGGTGTGTVNLTGAFASLYVLNTTTLDNVTVNIGNSSGVVDLYNEDTTGTGSTQTFGTHLSMAVSGQAQLVGSSSSGDTLVNQGSINIASNGTLAIIGQAFSNNGQISVTNANLKIYQGFTNSGLITLTNSFLDLRGTVATGTLSSLFLSSTSVEIDGLLTNFGTTLSVGSGSTLGTIDLTGRIQAGTVHDAGKGFLFQGGTLDGLTYQGTLDLSGASDEQLYIADGITLTGTGGTGTGTVNLTGAFASLYVLNTTTLDNVTVNIGNSSGVVDLYNEDTTGTGSTQTFGTHLSMAVSGQAQLVGSSSSGDTLVNQGSINIASNGTLAIIGQAFSNNGQISVTNANLKIYQGFTNSGLITLTNSFLDLRGTVATGTLSSLFLSSTSVEIDGLLTNFGTTLSVGSGSTLGTIDLTGRIQAGTVHDAGKGFLFQGGTLDGLTYQGTLDLSGASDEQLYIADGITLTGTGGTGTGTVNLTGAFASLYVLNTTTLDNVTVNIGNSSGVAELYNEDTTGTGSTQTFGTHLSMAVSGQAELVGSSSSGDILVNQGSIGVTSSSKLTVTGQSIVNTGSFGVHNSSSATVNGSFANNGSAVLHVDAGSGEGGSSFTVTGTLNNAATVQIGPSNLNVGAATTVSLGGLVNNTGASFQAYGSSAHAVTLSFTGGTSAFTSNGGDFGLYYAAPLTLGSSFTNTGSFGVHLSSSVTVDGDYANNGSAVLHVDAGSGEGGSSFTVTGTLNNAATVQIGPSNLNVGAATTVSLGGLVNNTGASFQAYGSSAHAVTLSFTGGTSAFTSNGGDFGLYYAAPLTLGSSFTNTGSFGVHLSSSVTVDGDYANNGSAVLHVDAGSGEGGSGFTVTGTLNNAATVQIGPSNLNVGAATTVSLGGLVNNTGASFQAYGSSAHAVTLSFTGGTSAFTSNGGDFDLYYAAPLTLGSSFTNTGSFGVHLSSSVTVDGGYANNGSALLYVDNGNGEGGSSFTVTGTLNNAATVQIGPSNLNVSAPTTVSLGGLVNNAGASFQAFGSSAHAVTLSFTGGASAFTSNAGNFGLFYAAPLTLGSSFTNTGSFGVHLSSSVTVDGGFANNSSALLYVDNGNGEGGSSFTVTGTLNNAATVQIGPTNLNVSATTTVSLGGLVNNSGASFQAFGSSAHAVALSFTGGASAFTSNAGSVGLYDVAPLTLGSSFTNTGSFAVHLSSSVTVDGGFANNGSALLYVDNGNGEGGSSVTVTGTLNNAATVQIGPTNLNVSAATTVSLGGLINNAGASFQAFGSSAHAVTLSFTGGASAFTSNAGSFGLYYAKPVTLGGSFTNTGSFGLHDHSSVTVNGGFANNGSALLYVDNGNGEGGSSFTVAGTLNNAATVQIGPSNQNLSAATTLTLGGLQNTGTISTFGNSSSVQATMTVAGLANNAGNISIGNFSALQVTSNNVFNQTAGTTTVRGSLTASSIDIGGGTLAIDTTSFTNQSTLWAFNGGLIDASAGGLTNLSAGVLTGGVYEVDANSTLTFASSASLTTDNADIILKGTAALIQSGTTALNAELTSTGSSGILDLESGASFNAVSNFIDNGQILLNAGTFAASTLGVSTTGTVYGTGVVAANIQNIGTVEATGGRLVIAGTASGAGTFTIAAAAVLEFDNTVQSGATVTFGGIGSTLALRSLSTLGSVSVPAATQWYNSGINVTAGETLVITASGTINIGGGTLITPAGAPAPANTQTQYGPFLAPSLMPYSLIAKTGSSAAVEIGSDGTFVATSSGVLNLSTNDDVFSDNSGSWNVVVSTTETVQQSAFAGTLAAFAAGETIDLLNTTATAATIVGSTIDVTLQGGGTLAYTTATPLTGLDLATVSDGAGGTDIVAYRIAAASVVTPNPVNFTNHHVGDSVTQPLSVSNIAANDGYSENLDGSVGASAPITASGSFTGLGAAQTNNSSLVVGINTGADGVKFGTATVSLASDGTGIDGHGTTPLSSQTVSVSGTVYAYASPTVTASVNFGVTRNTSTMPTQTVTISNGTSADAYQERLRYALATPSSLFSITSGGGGTVASGSGMNETLAMAVTTPGTITGSDVVTLTSTGIGTSGLADTGLGTQTVSLTGTVFATAIAQGVPSSVNFGAVHQNAAASQSLSITNGDSGALTDSLLGGFSSVSAPFSGSGSISLASGQTGTLSVAMNTGTVGVQSGSASLNLSSHDTALADISVPTNAISLSGTVYAYAAPIVSTATLNFGAARVSGASLTQGLTIQDGSSANPYQESLIYSVAATSPFGVLAGGSGTVASGGSSTATLTLTETTAGAFNNVATVGETSTGAGTSGLANTILSGATVDLTGKIYATATAAPSTGTVNFGVVHVNDAIPAKTVTVGNAATGALTDTLTGGWGTVSGGFDGSGSLNVAAGGSGTLTLGMLTNAAGAESGTATLSVDSFDADLGALALSNAGSVALAGTIDNYATAQWDKDSGSGSFTQGATATLDFGTVTIGSSAPSVDLEALNTGSVLTDLMGGSFVASGTTGFTNSGFGSFSGEGAGQADTSPTISLATGQAGTFTEMVTLEAYGTNASGYFGTLSAEVLKVTGTVQGAGGVTITGAVANQQITDQQTLAAFSGVSINDSNSGQTAETVTVTLSSAANGALSSTGGGNFSAGVWTMTGSLAAVNTALDELVFTPTAYEVAPGQTETTTFTISDTDSPADASATDSHTSVIVTAGTAAISIIDLPATPIQTAGTTSVTLFPSAAVVDPNFGQTETVTVTMSAAANGSLSSVGGGTFSAGVWSMTGSLSAINTALDELKFTPVANSGTTDFTIHDVDTAGISATGTTISVIDNLGTVGTIAVFSTGLSNSDSLLAAGTVDPHYLLVSEPAGTGSAYVVNSGNPIAPNGPWLSDDSSTQWIGPTANQANYNTLGTFDYRTTFDLTGFNLNTAVIEGEWSSDNQAVIELNGVATGNTLGTEAYGGLTDFTIASGFTAGSNTLDFIVTNIAAIGGGNDPTGLFVQISEATADTIPGPSVTGTVPNQPITGTATIALFSGVTIDDANIGQAETVTITLTNDGTATDSDGVLSGSGLSKTGTGSYTMTAASAAAMTTALDALIFTPGGTQVFGQPVTTDFTITDTDTAGASATDSSTSVIDSATPFYMTSAYNNGTVDVDVWARAGDNAQAADITLTYSATAGTFAGFQGPWGSPAVNAQSGTIVVAEAGLSPVEGTSTDGLIGTFAFVPNGGVSSFTATGTITDWSSSSTDNGAVSPPLTTTVPVSAQLSGTVYSWKDHALLNGAAVVATGSGDPAGAGVSPIDLQDVHIDANGNLVAEVWANAGSGAENFDATFDTAGSIAANFTQSAGLPWTVQENNTNNGTLALAGAGLTNLTGEVELGTVTWTLPANTTQAAISLVSGDIGTTSAAPLTLDYGASATGSAGTYSITVQPGDTYNVNASLSASDVGNAITSADALATLKIAVGINPNPVVNGVQLPVSPYQFIAADANGNGVVTSADALAILKMAVGLPVARPASWVFLNEDQTFFNNGTFTVGTNNVPTSFVNTDSLAGSATMNLVGVLTGDVNGSWVPVDTNGDPIANAPTVAPTYFEQLAGQLAAPLSLWGIDPIVAASSGNDTIFASPGATLQADGNADTMTFLLAADSPVVDPVTVGGFNPASDVIDLSSIDANDLLPGGQTFNFIGTAGFSGAAGELRYFTSGNQTIIQGSTHGTGASFQIDLSGSIVLQAANFKL